MVVYRPIAETLTPGDAGPDQPEPSPTWRDSVDRRMDKYQDLMPADPKATADVDDMRQRLSDPQWNPEKYASQPRGMADGGTPADSDQQQGLSDDDLMAQHGLSDDALMRAHGAPAAEQPAPSAPLSDDDLLQLHGAPVAAAAAPAGENATPAEKPSLLSEFTGPIYNMGLGAVEDVHGLANRLERGIADTTGIGAETAAADTAALAKMKEDNPPMPSAAPPVTQIGSLDDAARWAFSVTGSVAGAVAQLGTMGIPRAAALAAMEGFEQTKDKTGSTGAALASAGVQAAAQAVPLHLLGTAFKGTVPAIAGAAAGMAGTNVAAEAAQRAIEGEKPLTAAEAADQVARGIAMGVIPGAAGHFMGHGTPAPSPDDLVQQAQAQGTKVPSPDEASQMAADQAAIRGQSSPATSSAPPQAGEAIGLKFPKGPSQRATVDQYFDNGQSVRVRFDNGQVQDYLTADVLRDRVAAPPPMNEAPAPGGPAVKTPSEGESFDLMMEGERAAQAAQPQRQPSTPTMGGDAVQALQQADALEFRAANDPSRTAEQRADDYAAAMNLRRRFGASKEAPAFSQDQLDRAAQQRAAGQGTDLMGQNVPPIDLQPPQFTDEQLGRAAVMRQQAVQQAQQARDAAAAAAQAKLKQDADNPPRRPADLLDFLSKSGGVRDDTGDLAAMDAGLWHTNQPFRRKLVNPNGLSLPMAFEKANEAGYGPYHDEAELLDAIRDNLGQTPHFAAGDMRQAMRWEEAQQEQQPILEQLHARAHELGLDIPPNWTGPEILAEIHEREGMMADNGSAEALADRQEAEDDAWLRVAHPDLFSEIHDGRADQTAQQPTPAQGLAEGVSGPQPAAGGAREYPFDAAVNPGGGEAAGAGVAAQPQGVSRTTREPASDIRAQIDAMMDPATSKDAVFVARDNEDAIPHDLPQGILAVARPEGVLLTTDPAKAERFQASDLNDNDMAQMLGYPEPKAAAVASGQPVAIQGKDAAGNVVADAVASPSRAAETARAIGAQVPAGGSVAPVSPVEAQQRRDLLVSQESPTPIKRNMAAAAAWYDTGLDETDRELLRVRLERRLAKTGQLTFADIDRDLTNRMDTATLGGLKDALANDPRGALEALSPSPVDQRGTRAAPVKVATPEDVELARRHVDQGASAAQIIADNAKLGHMVFGADENGRGGIPIAIETPKGGVREDKHNTPPKWRVENFPADYGRIKRTVGADNEHVDVFVGPNPKSDRVFVIDQHEPGRGGAVGKFDETKTMLGFDDAGQALAVYDRAFSDGSGPERMGHVAEMSVDQFKDWLRRGDTTAPAREAVNPANPMELHAVKHTKTGADLFAVKLKDRVEADRFKELSAAAKKGAQAGPKGDDDLALQRAPSGEDEATRQRLIELADAARKAHDAYQKGVEALRQNPDNEYLRNVGLDRLRQNMEAAQRHYDQRFPDAALQRAPDEGGAARPMVPLTRGLEGEERPTDTYTAHEAEIADKFNGIVKALAPKAEPRVYGSMRATGEPGETPGRVYGASFTERDPEGAMAHILAGSLESSDPEGMARHEVFHHVFRSGLLDADERHTTLDAARRLGMTDEIKQDYGHLPLERQYEEAAAEMYRKAMAEPAFRQGLPGAVQKVLYKINLFLRRVAAMGRQVLGRDATADDIFGRIESGEVGRRSETGSEASVGEAVPAMVNDGSNPVPLDRSAEPVRHDDAMARISSGDEAPAAGRPERSDGDQRGGADSGKPAAPERGGLEDERAAAFQRAPRDEQPEVAPTGQDYLDDVSDQIAETVHGQGAGTYARRLARSLPDPGAPLGTKMLGQYEKFVIQPRTLAATDWRSARYWDAWRRKDTTMNGLRHDWADQSQSYVALSSAQRKALSAVEELDRINGVVRPNDGRRVVARNDDNGEAEFTKPGQSVALDPATSAAYHDRRALFADVWHTLAGASAKRLGWDGPADADAIRRAAEAPMLPAGQAKRLHGIADLVQAMAEQEKTGYTPLMRFGDYYIAVKPKEGTVPDSLGGFPETKRFELVDSRAPFDTLFGKTIKEGDAVPAAAAKRIAELQAKYGPDFDIEHGYLARNAEALRKLDIPAIEKMFVALGQKDSELFGPMVEQLRDKMYEELKAGFKKRARTVPGYSTDWDRATGSYLGWTSGHAAEMLHGDAIRQAQEAYVDRHPDKAVQRYWQKWADYQKDPAEEMQKLRQFGFYWALAGNPSSMALIATHGPMVAHATLGAGGGFMQAGRHLYGALGEAIKNIGFDTEHGLHINIDALGKTPAEKALLAQMVKDGQLHEAASDDIRGLGQNTMESLEPVRQTWKKMLNIAASTVGVTDQMNRAGVALASYRLAQDPAQLARIAKTWGSNEIFREMTKRDGLNPETVAKFMVDEGLFVWGKHNRAPIQRGMAGTMLFQFRNFEVNYLGTLWKMMHRMGPEGKGAAVFMLGGLGVLGGAMGLPFSQDIENAGDALGKVVTGIDPQIGAKLASLLEDSGFSQMGAEMLLRGPSRAALGIDLTSRLGMGEAATRNLTPTEALGVVPSMLYQRLSTAWNRYNHAQPLGAAAELLPSAARNAVRGALVYPKEGVRSQYGNVVVPKEKVTAGEQVAQGLGFEPANVARAYEQRQYASRTAKAGQDQHSRVLSQATELVAQAADAQRAGDARGAQAANDSLSALIKANPNQHISPAAIHAQILARENAQAAALKHAPKSARQAISSSPFVSPQ